MEGNVWVFNYLIAYCWSSQLSDICELLFLIFISMLFLGRRSVAGVFEVFSWCRCWCSCRQLRRPPETDGSPWREWNEKCIPLNLACTACWCATQSPSSHLERQSETFKSSLKSTSPPELDTYPHTHTAVQSVRFFYHYVFERVSYCSPKRNLFD